MTEMPPSGTEESEGELERGIRAPRPGRRPRLELGYWDLDFVCILFLGYWNLSSGGTTCLMT